MGRASAAWAGRSFTQQVGQFLIHGGGLFVGSLVIAGDDHALRVDQDLGRQGVNAEFLSQLDAARTVIAVDSKDGRIVIKGWRESTDLTAESVLRELEPYCSGFLCTYVDKEGMMQGTDLDWFRRLRAATSLELTAAGGVTTLDDVRALLAMNVHAALGMAIYTGRLKLEDLLQLSA